MDTTADDAASAATVTFEQRRGPLDALQHALHRYPLLSPMFVLVTSWLVFAWASETGRFATWTSTGTILNQTAVMGTLAVGQTLIVLTAGIDLAVGTAMLLTHIVIGKVVRDGLWLFSWHVLDPQPASVAIVVGAVCALAIGLFHGALVTRVKLPPFIVTLGTFYIFQSLGNVYSKAQTLSKEELGGPDGLLLFGSRSLQAGEFKIIYGVVIMVVLYAMISYALSFTAWGRHVYAVGDDPEAAQLAGINVKKVLISVYVVAAAVYLVGAWVMLGRAESATMNNAADVNLETITAVVIGGTSLFGGRGRVWGTLFGALVVSVFRLGLKQAGVDVLWQNAAIGSLIIIAVALDQWIRRVGK